MGQREGDWALTRKQETEPPQGDDPDAIAIRGDWGDGPEQSEIHFSDQMIASYCGEYVILTLGQVAQPQFLPTDMDAIERIKSRGTVPIRTQFRTAVPASNFADFLRNVVKVAKMQGILIDDGEDLDADR